MVVSGPLGAVRIGPAKAMVLMAVCAKPDGFVIDYLALSESVWPDADVMPDGWLDVLRSHLSAVRRVLHGIGSEISIVTLYGMGVAVRRAPVVAANDDAELKKVSNS
jgi:DNA-binding winged helix-turn-helix (wHTH) protein